MRAKAGVGFSSSRVSGSCESVSPELQAESDCGHFPDILASRQALEKYSREVASDGFSGFSFLVVAGVI